MIIIGFSAKAEHGKTFLANILENELSKKGYTAIIQPLAKKMKEQAKLCGWDGYKDERGRRLLQEFSKPIKHYHGSHIYAKWAIDEVKEKFGDGDNVVMLIDDVRMHDEMNYIKDSPYENYFIRLNRPGYESSLTAEQRMDETETQLDNYKDFDLYLDNDGTMEGARKNARMIIEKVGL